MSNRGLYVFVQAEYLNFRVRARGRANFLIRTKKNISSEIEDKPRANPRGGSDGRLRVPPGCLERDALLPASAPAAPPAGVGER